MGKDRNTGLFNPQLWPFQLQFMFISYSACTVNVVCKKERWMLRLILFTSFLLVIALSLSSVQSRELSGPLREGTLLVAGLDNTPGRSGKTHP